MARADLKSEQGWRDMGGLLQIDLGPCLLCRYRVWRAPEKVRLGLQPVHRHHDKVEARGA